MLSNPLCDLAHYRLLAVFHLRTLGVLDRVQISGEERIQAEERFAQEEIENLEIQLEAREKRFQALEADHTTALDEKKKSEDQALMLKKKTKANQEQIKELENELKAKDELLKRKTAELTKACEKQFKLEQELAFHKIDAKFEPLPDAAFMDQVDGGTEESPYIGRASYRRNQYATEQYLTPRSQQLRLYQTGGEGDVDPLVKRQLNETLDITLADKEKEIARAEERLDKLHKQLIETEGKVRLMSEKLRQAEARKQPKPELEAGERHRLEDQLAERLRAVAGLKSRMNQLEDSMQTTLDIIEAKDREMTALKEQLAILEEGDPKHAELEAQLADRELQAAQTAKNYTNLQHDLDNTLGRLTAEMDRVKGLEQQLADGQANLNDELRDELQAIVGGLTEYLNQVRGQVSDQQRENAKLQQDREELRRQLAEALDREKTKESKEIEALHKKLQDAEEALGFLETENQALQHSQLELTRQDPERDARLKAAQEEVKQLKNSLRKQQQKAEAERAALEEELAASHFEQGKAARQAKQTRDQQGEAEAAARQLADVQAANRALKDRLREQMSQYNNLLNTSLNPEEVAQRINQVGDSLNDGRVNGFMGHHGDGDVVGDSLAELQGQIRGRLGQIQQEADRARRYQQKAEGEAKSLRHQLEQMQARLKGMMNKDRNRRREEDREDEEELKRMREELQRLRQELDDSQNQQPPPFPPQPQVATISDTQGQAPLNDPRVRGQMQRLQGDLAGLQNQIKEKDRIAAQQLADAEKEILQLQAELRKRDREARENERVQQRAADQQAREYERQKASALAKAEIQGGQLAQRAIDELAKAQEEISNLEELLGNREKELEDTLHHGERATQAVAEQEEEIAALHDVLGAQRDEIMRLQDLLDQLTRQPQTSPQTTTDLQNLLGEIDALRQSLGGQQHHLLGRGMDRRASYIPADSAQGLDPGGRGFLGNRSSAPQGQPMSPNIPAQHGTSFMPMYPGNMNQRASVSYGPSIAHLSQYQPATFPSTWHQVGSGGVAGGHEDGGYMRPTSDAQGQVTTSNQPPFVEVPMVHPSNSHAPPQVPPMQTHVQSHPFTATMVHTNAEPPDGGTISGQYRHPVQGRQSSTSGVHQNEGMDHTIEVTRRGILRRVEGPSEDLFCNVPEHHNMEDEIDRLRKQLEKAKKMKRRERRVSDVSSAMNSSHRLRQDLMDKREELDALDLAVSRQQGALRRLREDGRDLQNQKESKLRELRDIDKAVNDRRSRREFLEGRRRFIPEEDDFEVDEDELLHQTGFLEDEVECLEQTLAKRRAELREADRLLVECQTNLHEAQDKAREMVHHYDKVKRDLALAKEEHEELDRRAHEAAIDLLKAQEQVKLAEEDAERLEERCRASEKAAQDIENHVKSRETAYKGMETQLEQNNTRLMNLRSEVILCEQKLSELESSLRDRERELANKHRELDSLTDQLDQQQQSLEQVTHEVGAKQTDLRTLTSEVDKHRNQLVSALEEGEREITATEQKIKDAKAHLVRLRHQKQETVDAVEQQREVLVRLHARCEEAEGSLQETQSAIDKHKSELQHTLEMVQIEKTELEALRVQHQTKMAELEKAQLEALQEKTSLEKLQGDTQRSRMDAELMREETRQIKLEQETLIAERKVLESNISELMKEEAILKQDCNTLENKLSHLKVTYRETTESLHTNQHKLDGVRQELVSTEVDLNDTSKQKSEVVRELHSLRHQVKETRSDLKQMNSDVQETRGQKTGLQQEIEVLVREKAQLTAQLDQFSNRLEEHHLTLDKCEDEKRRKGEVLQEVVIQVEEKRNELVVKERELEKLVKQVTEEENRLAKILRNIAIETESKQAELESKQRELERLGERKNSMRARLDQNQVDLERFTEMEDRIHELESEMSRQQDTKLNVQTELEETRQNAASLKEEKDNLQLQCAQLNEELKQVKSRRSLEQKDFRDEHRKLVQDIERLKTSLEEETTHASRMNKEVQLWRQEYLNLKQQLHTHEELMDQDTQLDSQLQHLKTEIQKEVHEGLSTLELSRLEVLDELKEVHHQKAEINKKIHSFQQQKLRDLQTEETSKSRHRDLNFQLQQEQDLLKLRLEQQMSRQAEILTSIKQKSETTILSLRHKLDHLEDLVSSNSLTHSRARDLPERLEHHVSLSHDEISAGDSEAGTKDADFRKDSAQQEHLTWRHQSKHWVKRSEKTHTDTSVDIPNQSNVVGSSKMVRIKFDALSESEERTRKDSTQRGQSRTIHGSRERSILKRRLPPAEQEDSSHHVLQERSADRMQARGRRKSEELSSPAEEVTPSQRPRSHSYRHQRRLSRSPVLLEPFPVMSLQAADKGPSDSHWSEFMDSLNQLKTEKVTHLNTNVWKSQ
ncbi:centriolin-like [Diadema setosum]|uniref:centriolin-like n=1 Tax=Diadema setosum TaxID=31175 RepID=UPI003B3A0D48